MAIAFHHFEVEVSLTESSGKSVPRTYVANPDEVTDYAGLLAAFALAIPIINAATDSVMSKIAYKAIYVENALVLPANAENSDQAYMTAKIAGDPTDSADMSIPAASIACFVSSTGKGRDVVDTSDGSVAQDYAELFEAGGNWTISDGEQITIATLGGKRRNVKSTGT